MIALLRACALAAGLIATSAPAQVAEQSANDDRDFDLPAEDVDDLVGDGGLDLGDADFTGNPLGRLTAKWPEDLVIAPVPGRSPQFGWQLTLGAGYFLNSQTGGGEADSHPSIVGGFGMASQNGSYAYGAGSYLHLLNDSLRIRTAAAYADVRYRYYGVGNAENELGVGIEILQEMPLYLASVTYRVWNRLYVGLGYTGGTVNTRARVVIPNPQLVIPLGDLDIGAWMIPVEYDTRDQEQFPRDGIHVTGRAMLYSRSSGSDFNAETYKIAGNYYLPVGERNVLASRAVIRWTKGDAPFFLKSSFGGGTDLRGYPAGRFRDNMMYALQTEYRWHFSERWIFTGFAGVGEVARSFGDFGENLLPAGGIGARYLLSKKHRVGLSFDLARGKTGTEYYFGVGEAF